ncbi:MAG: hypothetical protein E7E42_06450 [Veillonella sp.]|nr:hypothetical protein [Veillonella sp.]
MTHSRNYRTLRHLILPALAGSALAALAFAPTFGAEPVQANVPAQSISAPRVDVPKADVPRPDDVKTGEINEPAPHKEANPSTFTGTAVIIESKTFEHQRFDNTISDQNSFIGKNKATITIDSSVFDKTGNTSNDDNSNFRGQNAVALGIEGSQTSIKNSNITSSSIGSNAVFATDEGSIINVENTNIHTKGDSSRGLDATYKGTVNGKNLTITTEGAHSATLATDRGEGTITAEAAKLITSGEGSPVIYSTGNIMVNNVNGIANNSEIGVVEGKNSITLTNSNVTGYKDNGFMLYQSFSGDAESGIARLKAAADSRWGKTGENGGHLTLRASNQELRGNIMADSISTIALDMTNGSSLVGAVNTDNTAKEVTVKLSKDSSWTLTGDSYVESLTNEDTTGENIHLNGYKLVVADK